MKFYYAARLLFLLSFFVLLFSSTAWAHKFDYAAVDTKMKIEKNGLINLHSEVPKRAYVFEDQERDKRVSEAFAKNFYQFSITESFTVTASGEKCDFMLDSYSIADQRSVFDGKFTCKHEIKNIDELTIENKLFDRWLNKYDNYLKVEIGQKNWDLVFNKEKTKYPEQVSASGPNYTNIKPVAKEFTKSGVEHIWKGYDHLLFLFAAILLLRKLKNILIVVTSFTIAHSITLSLAAFDIVTLPSRIVEPLIALTIVFLAARNLFLLRSEDKSDHIKERWSTTFGFGLIHGLGFASVLKETGIPDQYFAAALAFFNIGIELGQLAVLLIAIPILLLIDKHKKRRHILSFISAIIVIYAVYLAAQRIFG